MTVGGSVNAFVDRRVNPSRDRRRAHVDALLGDGQALFACALEVEWAADAELPADLVRVHAVPLGPPLDTAAVCGWRYSPDGLSLDRDWMTTSPSAWCRDCADALGALAH
jgi:hypothetical protein